MVDGSPTAAAVGWGVLGAARIAEGYLLPALVQTPGCRLHAIGSRRLDAAHRLRAQFDATAAYDGYQSVLDDPEVDAVYIALPNALHVPWTIAALKAGKHVLCEKPMAMVPEHIDDIATAARSTGRLAAEAFMYRHHPQFHRLLQLVRDDVIGPVHSVRGALSFVLDAAEDIRMSRELGGGSRLDLACYVVDAAVAVYGEAPVGGRAVGVVNDDGVDLHLAGVLEFRGGRTASVQSSFRLPWLESPLQVYGELGSLTLPHAFNPGTAATQLIHQPFGKPPQATEFAGVDMYRHMVADFMAAIGQPHPPARDLDASRAVQVGLSYLTL